MPKKGKDRFKEEHLEDDVYEASDNVARDVAEELDANAGIDPHANRPEDHQVFPPDNDDESPAHSIGGVRGRPTPREFDEPWVPAEGGNAMGEKPKPAHESVGSPRAGANFEEFEDVVPTETPQQAYAERMKADLEERGIHIDQLMSHAQGTEAAVRHAYLQQIDNLRALQDQAAKALDEFASAGSSTWEGMQESVDEAFGTLRSAVGDAMHRMFGSEDESKDKPEEEC